MSLHGRQGHEGVTFMIFDERSRPARRRATRWVHQ